MIAAAREFAGRDLGFLDELSGTDPVLLRFLDFNHGDFSSTIIRFFLHTMPDGGGRRVDRIDEGYATACRYLAAFFDASLRGSSEGAAFPEPPSAFDGVSIER